MNIVYDMGTGAILDYCHQPLNQPPSDTENINLLPSTALQEIRSVTCEARQIPPELALTDLNRFLKAMS